MFKNQVSNAFVWFRLINKMVPGHVKKINTKGGNFALMENLAAIQKGMRIYGVPEDELFQPVDLFEARNVKAVVRSLAALARIVSGWIFSVAHGRWHSLRGYRRLMDLAPIVNSIRLKGDNSYATSLWLGLTLIQLHVGALSVRPFAAAHCLFGLHRSCSLAVANRLALWNPVLEGRKLTALRNRASFLCNS